MDKKHKVRLTAIIILYLAATFLIIMASRSNEGVRIFNDVIPAQAFTGVLSSLANILIIVMVVMFRKPGFIAAIALLLAQFPVMFVSFFTRRNLLAIPGAVGNIFTILIIIIIYRRNRKIEKYMNEEVDRLKDRQKFSQHLFEQTATALVNAVDAKDAYSHGHSLRVAEYSEKIARAYGKDDSECYRIYYAALLHDVGKIGIPNTIINKKGKLTKEEYDIIKGHPVKGNQILSSINEYPYLSIGAHFHHERYDGKGYPSGLKGEDIPEIARIISVADAYDAMSSNRSYRDAIPQHLVREEIVKGAGTQFDPVFADIMKNMIDHDSNYSMREKNAVNELAGRNDIKCDVFRSQVSDGIQITKNITRISMRALTDRTGAKKSTGPAFILFDSLDGRIHEDEKTAAELLYYEYGTVWLDGGSVKAGARKIEEVLAAKTSAGAAGDGDRYEVEAVKYKDHVLLKVDHDGVISTVTIALPDSSRYFFIAITGSSCDISDVSIVRDEEEIGEGYIPRIAPEISYIDAPEGDIPNVQIDSVRSDSSSGVEIKDRLEITFGSRSLPTSRLIWHCPYLVIFTSKDGKVGGEDYMEYGLIRLDGEVGETEEGAVNSLIVEKSPDFAGWDAWKEYNRSGIDVKVNVEKRGKDIILKTENFGISINNTTAVSDDTKPVYIAITGDQCAVTGIRISRR